MQLPESDIADVAQSIWDAMFDESLALTPGGSVGEPPFVTSFVAINGAWQGAVVAQFPQSLAAALTRQLFSSETEPTSDEIHDALGEIGNIVAGNVKALVPEPSHLSLPAVAFGNDYGVSVFGATEIVRTTFTCDGQVFSIAIVESTGASELRFP